MHNGKVKVETVAKDTDIGNEVLLPSWNAVMGARTSVQGQGQCLGLDLQGQGLTLDEG